MRNRRKIVIVDGLLYERIIARDKARFATAWSAVGAIWRLVAMFSVIINKLSLSLGQLQLSKHV